jgi:hypothetical protein
MDILEKAFPIQKILKTMEILQFGTDLIQLVGTGSLKSQIYPADFDFMEKITNKMGVDESYDEFKRIINNIYAYNELYFIEFKFQSKDGNKHKIFNRNDFTKETFNKYFNYNINYCKIDAIIDLDGHFKEVSAIYFFNDDIISVEDYRKALLEDMKHYYDDGKYYKSLKRLLVSAKISNPPDLNLIITISKLFNSMVGRLYQIKNELDACLIFLDKFKSPRAIKMANIFLNNIGLVGLKIEDIQKISDDYGKLIDSEGLKFYKKYNIKVGVLPKYNTVKGGQKNKIKSILNKLK